MNDTSVAALAETSLAAVPKPSFGRVVQHPLCAVSVLLACVLYMTVGLCLAYDDPAGADQSLNAAVGHEILNGRRLYADVWDQKPPLVYVAYAASELLVGYGRQQFFLLNLAGWTVTLAGLYLSARLMAGPLAGIGAGLLWAFLVVQDEWYAQPNGEIFMNLGLVWCFYCLLRLMAAPGWWLACGFGAAAGFASLAKPTAFVPVGLMGIAYLIASIGRAGGPSLAIRHMFAAAGVSIAIWLGWVAWFWSQGTLGDFYDTVVVYNRHYSGGSVLQNLAGIVQKNHKKFLLTVLGAILAVPFLAQGQSSAAERRGWLILAAWGAGCAIAIALTGHWYVHYYHLWMPVYALAGGALLAIPLAGPLPMRGAVRAALLAAAFVPLAQAHDRRLTPEQGRLTPNRVEARRAGIAIDHELRPHETVYCFGYLGLTSGVYFHSGRRPVSGVMFDVPVQSGPLAGRLEERILRDLDRAPPDMLVLTRQSFLPGPRVQPLIGGKPAVWGERLCDWISGHYVERAFPASTKFAYYARRGSDLERRLPEVQLQ
jgi:Dolichyl-phosphate-mannose-protein mannosyltransferase